MPGVYIHIPYCRQACNYCNFHFSVSHKNRLEYVAALAKEIELTKNFFQSSDANSKIILDTLYIGGGTPSVLSYKELIEIFKSLSLFYYWDDKTEITIEANPDDLTISKLEEFKELGINRLSIGIQSFFDEDLKYMNRAHNSIQAEQSILNAQKAGFKNITIDLIYGTPTLSDENWIKNLNRAREFKIPHISAYALTVEEKTPLDMYIRKGKSKAVSDENSAGQFEMMTEWMEKNGYQHYEISNFGKPGFFSRHNISYWTGTPYLGLGAAAHSYTKSTRFWNISNTTRYIDSIKNDILPREIENLSKSQQINEYIMTSLRTMWGCDLEKVNIDFGVNYKNSIIKSSEKYIRNQLLIIDNNHLIITNKGKFLADGIAADLFVD